MRVDVDRDRFPELSPDERAEVAELRRRDAEVRAHEAAHAAAAGASGGGPSFSFTTGPDGKRYAVSGEVAVQIRPGRTPEETIRNASRVRAAALAPAEPSAQDRAVAAEAAAMEAAARAELMAHPSQDSRRASSEPPPPPDASAATLSSAPDAPAPTSSSAPDDSLLALQNERGSDTAGWRHLHSAGGCGVCAARVAVYSSAG